MPVKQVISSYALSAVAALALLAGCDDGGREIRAKAAPIGQAGSFEQSPPAKPLFGSDDYVRDQDVMPVAKNSPSEPLPAAVPLPAATADQAVIAPHDPAGEPADEQGGVTPAAGMAAVITNAQGDGEEHKLDGGSVKK